MKLARFTPCLGLLLILACDANPDERTLISGPRLLALRSTPPAILGVDGIIDLSALAIDADGVLLSRADVRYRACSPWKFMVDPDRDCPESSALALSDNQLSAQQLLNFYPPPSQPGDTRGPDRDETEKRSCAPDALLEVPIIAEITVESTTLTTVKRIPIYLREVSKRNPRIQSIEVVSDDEIDHTLAIQIAPSSLDLECRNEINVPEAVRIFFYSTSGSFESSSIDVIPSTDGSVEPAEVLWTASEAPASLFFVAIDNDGGVDWESLTL